MLGPVVFRQGVDDQQGVGVGRALLAGLAVSGMSAMVSKGFGQFHLLVAGQRGAGKTTLAERTFGWGTMSANQAEQQGGPFTIWEARAVEAATQDEDLAQIEKELRARRSDRGFHIAWLCLEEGREISPCDVALHKLLAGHLPVLGVVTKAGQKPADSAYQVLGALPQMRAVVRVRALSEGEQSAAQGPVGLHELIVATARFLAHPQRRVLVALQTASVEAKRTMALEVVSRYSSLAMLVGAAPLPFADALALVPLQMRMLGKIAALFGLDAATGALPYATAGSALTTFGGRALVSSLFKLLPMGAWAGATVTGSAAAALTAALGTSYVESLVHDFLVVSGG